MQLTIEDAAEVVFGDRPKEWTKLHDTYVIHEEYKDMMSVSCVFKHEESGKHYQFNWGQPTYRNEWWEVEDLFGWGDTVVEPTEVESVEETIQVWKPVKQEEQA